MMPKGWRETAIGEIAELINGRGFKPHEWKKSGLPIIRIQNLNGGGDFNYYDGNYDPKIEVHTHDLLYAWSGSRGTSFGPHIWKGSKGVLNYHTWKVQPKEELVNKHFLLHLLRKITINIENSAHGASALVHMQKWAMEEYKIQIPANVIEQEKIAEILSTWDEAIEKLGQLINKKTTTRNLIIEDIFTKKKSLGFKSWLEVKIGDLCEINSENISNKDKDFYYIDLSSVSSGKILYPNEKINQEEAPSRAKRKCQKNDILISNVRPNLKGFAVVDRDIENLVASTGFSVLRTKEHYIHMVYSSFYSTSITNQINSVVTGSNYPAMNSSDVVNFSIRIPKEEAEARKLGQVLEYSESEINFLKNIKFKLQLQKQGLMQQLLTGKKRVIV